MSPAVVASCCACCACWCACHCELLRQGVASLLRMLWAVAGCACRLLRSMCVASSRAPGAALHAAACTGLLAAPASSPSRLTLSLHPPTCSVRDNIIAAADEIGLAACVTSLYSNGSAVAVEQRHAGRAAEPEAAPKPSTPSDGFTGDGKLVPPDYPAGQTMQLAFDVAATAQCKAWNESTMSFAPQGAPKGEARRAGMAWQGGMAGWAE